MGFAGSADIFRAEMMDLMEALEYVRAYIDNQSVITRGTLEDHLDKLREVLRRLHEAGLKVNAAKPFFCTHEIEYLGYILTRGGIKPQLKKVQAILALSPPNKVRESQHFLVLDSPATLPVSTRVLIGRVVGLCSKSNLFSGLGFRYFVYSPAYLPDEA